MPHSAATADDRIDMLDPVSSQNVCRLPWTVISIIGTPDGDRRRGRVTGFSGNFMLRRGTPLNAAAHDSTPALSGAPFAPLFLRPMLSSSASSFQLSLYWSIAVMRTLDAVTTLESVAVTRTPSRASAASSCLPDITMPSAFAKSRWDSVTSCFLA